MNTNLICPISDQTINKTAGRIGASLTPAILVAYAFTGWWGLLLFVVLDYIVRVFTEYPAPVAAAAAWIAKVAGLKAKPFNKGPKIFAWRLGFLTAVLALILVPFAPTASIVVAVLLAALNILDGVFNLCVGCVIYTYLVLPYFGSNVVSSTSTHAPTDPQPQPEA